MNYLRVAPLFFETESAQSLTKAVNTLLDHKEAKQKLIELANERIQNFSWDASAARIALAFKTLLLKPY